MRLSNVQVRSYKSIIDSGPVEVQPDITCLIGRNESGKSALLEALYRINPAPTGHRQNFEELHDYPRGRRPLSADERSHTQVVEAVFELDSDDQEWAQESFGVKPGTASQLIVGRDYDNTLSVHVPGVEKDDSKDVSELSEALWARAPRLLYFDDVSVMPGEVSIARLQSTPEEELDPGERTGLALLRIAGIDTDTFADDNYEQRRAALELAANQLTDEVLNYWSQNRQLSVELDLHTKEGVAEPFLQVRIRSHRHRVTLNVEQHSSGFAWFFSLVALLADYRQRGEPLVVLLDEPGLGLHAAAERDLLRYIEERLAGQHQVIYTTHSPFMVRPSRLERARIVEDITGRGTVVTSDPAVAAPDSVYPLRAALGHELIDGLAVDTTTLFVTHPSDVVYLQVISDHLRGLRRTGLDSRWTPTPIGDLRALPVLTTQSDAPPECALVLNVSDNIAQRVKQLIGRGLLDGQRLVLLTEFMDQPAVELEDLLTERFYVRLLSASGISPSDDLALDDDGPLVERASRAINGPFSRYRPAAYLQHRAQLELLNAPDKMLEQFEALFRRVNALLDGEP